MTPFASTVPAGSQGVVGLDACRARTVTSRPARTPSEDGQQPSSVNLCGEQLLDRLGRRERAAIDTLEDGIERFEGARHVQVREDLPQAVASREGGALHAAPPASCAYAARARFSTVTTGRGARRAGVDLGAASRISEGPIDGLFVEDRNVFFQIALGELGAACRYLDLHSAIGYDGWLQPVD